MDHRTILRDNEKIRHPFALTLFGNYVYWTDWGFNALLRVRNIMLLKKFPDLSSSQFLVCWNVNVRRTIVITLLLSLLSSSIDKYFNLSKPLTLFSHTLIDSCYLNVVSASELSCLVTIVVSLLGH